MASTKSKEELEQFLHWGPWGGCKQEFHFHPSRKWRADYALLGQSPPVLIEYDGIMQHNRGSGLTHDPVTGKRLPSGNASHNTIANTLRDIEKANEAQGLGYRVYRCTAKSIQDGTFFAFLERVLEDQT